jgi:hypothetical protein
MHAIETKPLASIGMLVSNWAKLHRSSECAETLVALRGPGGHALKVDRSMTDLIVEPKVDCPKIQEY